MMEKKQCLIYTDKCENCQYWEPIPFHDDGGVCMAKLKVRKAILSDQSRQIKLEAALVKQ